MVKHKHRKKLRKIKIFESPGQRYIIIISILTVSAVVYLAERPQLQHRGQLASVTPAAQISITPNGFVPQEIAVKAGAQVTWVNNDISAHEIAADPYPLDNSIPGLKDTGVLHIGDSYTYTFLIPDTYHYHDELNPFRLTGTIVVGDK